MGAKSSRGGARPGAGRPRRTTISEKETIEKARSLGRQNMLAVMQGWIDDLTAEKSIVVGGGEHAYVEKAPDFAARQNARKEIADRCGFRFDPNEAPSDLGRALLDIFTKIET